MLRRLNKDVTREATCVKQALPPPLPRKTTLKNLPDLAKQKKPVAVSQSTAVILNAPHAPCLRGFCPVLAPRDRTHTHGAEALVNSAHSTQTNRARGIGDTRAVTPRGQRTGSR